MAVRKNMPGPGKQHPHQKEASFRKSSSSDQQHRSETEPHRRQLRAKTFTWRVCEKKKVIHSGQKYIMTKLVAGVPWFSKHRGIVQLYLRAATRGGHQLLSRRRRDSLLEAFIMYFIVSINTMLLLIITASHSHPLSSPHRRTDLAIV